MWYEQIGRPGGIIVASDNAAELAGFPVVLRKKSCVNEIDRLI